MELNIRFKITENGPDTCVFIDDCPIGLIQELKFNASADELIPNIEFTMYNSQVNLDPKLVGSLESTLDKLKKFLPYICIKEIDLDGNFIRISGRDLNKKITTKTEVISVTKESTIDIMNEK